MVFSGSSERRTGVRNGALSGPEITTIPSGVPDYEATLIQVPASWGMFMSENSQFTPTQPAHASPKNPRSGSDSPIRRCGSPRVRISRLPDRVLRVPSPRQSSIARSNGAGASQICPVGSWCLEAGSIWAVRTETRTAPSRVRPCWWRVMPGGSPILRPVAASRCLRCRSFSRGQGCRRLWLPLQPALR